MKLKQVLTRAHLAIGEFLGLTHYRNCWLCDYSCDVGCGSQVCGCRADDVAECVGGYMVVDPSEAVWCHGFKRGENE